jgi:hypothetical protein
MRLLQAAGARAPRPDAGNDPGVDAVIASLAGAVKKSVAMFSVGDLRATVLWYESIGFTVHDRYEDGGELTFARLSLGAGELTLTPGGNPGPRDVSLWFFTDRVEEIYQRLKTRQLRSADVRFDEDLYEPFYGGRQFSVRDPNGLSLIFWQPA